MTERTRKWMLPLVAIAAISNTANAQDDEVLPDARTQGYQMTEGPDGTVGKLVLKEGRGAASSWFILTALGLLAAGVMFKSGKRTHLD